MIIPIVSVVAFPKTGINNNSISKNPIITNKITTNPKTTNPISTNPITTTPIATNPITTKILIGLTTAYLKGIQHIKTINRYII